MMDFLQSLALPREGDRGRAVAAIPSHFAGSGPLRGPIASQGPIPTDGEGDPLALEPISEALAPRPAPQPAATRATAPRPIAVIESAPPAAGPRGDGSHEASESRAPAVAQQPAGVALAPREVGPLPALLDARRDRERSRVAPIVRVLDEATVGEATVEVRTEEHPRGSTRPIVPASTTAPLSAASLAHRVAKAPEEAVVHVSIGRIEVVANVAPPPAARRGSTPRPPTVALADYLRGERGGRR